jgi:hypothetical protein
MRPYDDVIHAIVADHLETDIKAAKVIDVDESPREAGRALGGAGFDQAPAMAGTKLVGFVVAKELRKSRRRRVEPLVHPFEASVLVSSAATIPELLGAFTGAPFLFVLGGRSVTGFVTPADLGKHPARTYFFLLLSDLEMGMARIVRERYGGGDAPVALLSPDRQQRVRNRHDELTQLDVEADYVSDLDFPDLLAVIGRTPELRGAFGYSSRNKWEAATGRLVGLRNHVMHPTRDFEPMYSSLPTLARLDERLRSLIEAARI